MPSAYAHYRFGAQLLKRMPPDFCRTAQRFRQLYDVGLHGPDIFFYYSPLMKTSVGSLGSKLHHQSGIEFFTRACKRLRLEPSEAGYAYLYGLLSHYCLDSVCHPFVNARAAEGKMGHVELETEFDRYLLVQDGKTPPSTHDISRHMKLTRGECATAASVYPAVTASAISRSVRNMALATRCLAMPQGLPRNVMEKGLHKFGGKYAQFLMTDDPNPICAPLNGKLEALYNTALERYPRLWEQLTAHLAHNAPLGTDFAPEFG